MGADIDASQEDDLSGHSRRQQPQRWGARALRGQIQRRGDNRLTMAAIDADGEVQATDTSAYAGRTAWARNLATPVRDFLGTETGGAIVLLAGTLLALLWANSPWPHSYESSGAPSSRSFSGAGKSRPTCVIGSTKGS